jgi:hypothetical protein
MKAYIALIRELGGQYTLPMTELARVLKKMGMRNVRAYIQSRVPLDPATGIEELEAGDTDLEDERMNDGIYSGRWGSSPRAHDNGPRGAERGAQNRHC